MFNGMLDSVKYAERRLCFFVALLGSVGVVLEILATVIGKVGLALRITREKRCCEQYKCIIVFVFRRRYRSKVALS